MSRISQGDRLYMGLEGHTEAESKEAMSHANITVSTHTLQHTHCLKSTHPDEPIPMHDADFRHYQWQVHTVAPLYFEVRITSLYTHIQFIQPLPRPTKMLKNATLQHPFKYAIGQDITYLIHPYNDVKTSIPNPELIDTYQAIFDECLRIYYLYCTSITRVDAMEKTYSRYGVYNK